MYIVFFRYYTYDWFIQILFLTRSNMKVRRGPRKKNLVTGLPAFSHAQVTSKDLLMSLKFAGWKLEASDTGGQMWPSMHCTT